MSYKSKFINKIFWITISIWSLIVSIFVLIIVIENYSDANILALNEAQTSTKKDLAFRSWVSSHGGVYVPITKKTQPNKYLAHIKNRDIETLDGAKLTLMNPAYTLSQIMSDYSKLYGIKGHITSKILLNPKNIADKWELKALTIVEKTKKPIYEKVTIDDKLYYRYLKPLITQKSCLKCHAFQGYKVGDVRGGVSIAIPMDSHNHQAMRRSIINIIFASILWLFGIILILFGHKKAKDIVLDKIKDYEQNIYSLITMIEKRDRYTAGHTQRVAKYASLIAQQMSYDEDVIKELYTACILHDIGKISTPDSILLKPGILTTSERKIIEEHVITGYEILKDIDIYRDIAEIMRHHHERYDGSGYPQKLKGDETPMLSQIMSVADAFDAMTTERIYKEKLTVDRALEEIKSLSGIYFHPQIVDAALIALEDINIDEIIVQTPQNELERERFSYFYKDQIIDGYNKDYLAYVICHNGEEGYQYRYIYMLYLHNFNSYNKTYGWSDGDDLLRNFAQKINDLFSEKLLFRVYGDDFIILTKNYIDMESYMDDLEKFLKESDIDLSYHYYNFKKENITSLKALEEVLKI